VLPSLRKGRAESGATCSRLIGCQRRRIAFGQRGGPGVP